MTRGYIDHHTGNRYHTADDRAGSCTARPQRHRHTEQRIGGVEGLGEGPEYRTKEKNDAFVQSWLQDTKVRDTHHREIEDGSRSITPRPFQVNHYGYKHKKRTKSPPEPPVRSLNGAKGLDHRFEKRARHKTRENKYDYQVYAKKRDPSHRDDECKPKRTPGSHMLVRASKQGPKANRLTQRLARAVSDPNATKSRFSRSQKEDKELEEFSAFFSRKVPQREASARDFDYHDYESSGRALTTDHRFQANRRELRELSNSPRRSHRGIASSEYGELLRYSSSLPAFQKLDPGRSGHCYEDVPSRVKRSRLRQDEGRGEKYGTGSYSPMRTGSHRSACETLSRISQNQNCPSLSESRGHGQHPPSKRPRNTIICKDAGAQTDPTPNTEETHHGQIEKACEGEAVEKQIPVNGARYEIPASIRGATHAIPQVPVILENESWSTLKPPRYEPYVEPQVEYAPLVGHRITSHSNPTQHIEGQPISYVPALLAERRDDTNLHKAIFEDPSKFNGVRCSGTGSSEGENMEQFIQRIEEEAELPLREAGDDGRRPSINFDLFPNGRRPMLCGVPGFGSPVKVDNTLAISRGGGFCPKPIFLAPNTVENEVPRFQEVGPPGVSPRSRSLLETYGVKEQKRGLGADWEHGTRLY